MKKKMLKIVIVFIALFATEYIFSQTPPPNRGAVPPGLPIDGGVFSLIAIAFGYGVNKLRNKSK